MQGTQIASEFHLSFQKIREHKLLDSFSLLVELFRGFCAPFFYWLNEFTGILSQHLKNRGEHSIGF